MYSTIVEAVLEHAAKDKNKLAVCFKQERLTYYELADRVIKAAYILKSKFHVGRADIVMISALSKPEFILAWLAVQFLGGVVVPVNKAMTEPGIVALYHFVNPKLMLSAVRYKDLSIKIASLKDLYSDSKSSDNFDEMEYELPDSNDVAEIIFTTGTTGNPKGAMLTYSNILHSTIYTRDGVGRNRDDVELIPLPLNHSFGLRVLRAILYTGATAVLQNGFIFLKDTTENIETYKCTGMSVVPASLDKLCRNLGEDFTKMFGNLRYLEVSAGSLSISSKMNVLEQLPHTKLMNVWGSSETGGAIFLDVRNDIEHIGSLGRAAEGINIGFLDEKGNKVTADSPDNIGRMIMSGPMCMKGYYHMHEATEQTIRDGYLYTNDMAYMTSDGFVYMMGRADDIINVGGEKVSPVEVEDKCGLYEDIAECVCVGGTDKTGEYESIPVLFVVPSNSGFQIDEFIQFAASKLEQYKVPKAVRVIDAIPRNAMQKPDRKALKKLWEESDSDISNPVVMAIYGRRSVRRFSDKAISREILEQIVHCGMQAPSGHNMQTWHFSVVMNKSSIEEIRTTVSPIAKRHGVYFYGFENPQALILVSNNVRNPYGIQDSSCAAQNIMLAAYSYGLGSVWLNPLMKLCDDPEIRRLLTKLGVPDGYHVWAMIALGYPANHPYPLAKREDVINWVE